MDDDRNPQDLRGEHRRKTRIASLAEYHVRIEEEYLEQRVDRSADGPKDVEEVLDRSVGPLLSRLHLDIFDIVAVEHLFVDRTVRHEIEFDIHQMSLVDELIHLFCDGDDRVEMPPCSPSCE